MIPNVYFSPKSRRFYLINKDYYCSICRKKIHTNLVVHKSWGRKDKSIFVTCFDCHEVSSARIVDEKILCVLTDKIPSEAIPHIITPPTIRPVKGNNDNELSLFEAVNLPSEEKDQDKTLLAGRETWQGFKIGNPDMKQIAKHDKPFKNTDMGLRYLDILGKAEPVLSHNEKKRLEHET